MKEVKTKIKDKDIFNRRQKERPLQLGMHDISCARYFTIGDTSDKYTMKRRDYTNDYAVYLTDFKGSCECIGFATPDRNKILIQVRRHGLDWMVRVSLSDIKIFGSKLPQDS